MADYSITRPNSLQIMNPELAKEWHPEKNGKLTANDVSAGSNKKVWWLGKCGHEWQATVCHRKSGRGCPICAGKKILPGFNDLKTKNPGLAEEWHPTKNGELTAEDVSAGSNKKVWWLGKCGHEWEARINSRVKGSGCLICEREKTREKIRRTLLEKSESLSKTNPELAEEWHPTKNGELTAEDVSAGSNKKVWWLGKCGHEWKASVYHRTNGRGCPACGKIKRVESYIKTRIKIAGSLLESNPELAKEWHPIKNGTLLPTDVAPMSERKVWWLGKCGHEWEMPISHRSFQGQGCPICAGERQTSFPEQAVFYYFLLATKAINRYLDHGVELDVYLPEEKVGIEYDGIRYHNSERARQKEKRKNEYLQKVGIRLIRIKEDYANRIENDVIFFKYTPSFRHLSWAIMSAFQLIGIEDILPQIDLDRDRGRIYAQYIQTIKENSLATKYPDLVKEWNYDKNQINPSMIPAASNKKVFWICANGHEWSAQVNSRIRGSGCPICAGKKVLPGYNDLATLNSKLAKEWHPTKNYPLLPSDVTIRSGKSVWWICENGHEWRTTIHTRTKGCDCPVCMEKTRHESRMETLLKQKGSLQTVKPKLAEEWHPVKNGDLTPSDITAGSNKKVWWLGKCGHEWYVSPHSRGTGSGCPICAGRKQNLQ